MGIPKLRLVVLLLGCVVISTAKRGGGGKDGGRDGGSRRGGNDVDEDLAARVEKYLPTAIAQAEEDLNKRYSTEASIATSLLNKSPHADPFLGVSHLLAPTTYVKQLSISAALNKAVIKNIKKHFDLSKREVLDILDYIQAVLPPNPHDFYPDGVPSYPGYGNCPYPTKEKSAHCDSHTKYRTIDGSCNNLDQPLFGKSFQPFVRAITPDYADDFDAPRVAKTGQLPGAREASLLIFGDTEQLSGVHTLSFMTFGQFLDHDITRTPVTQLSTDVKGEGELVPVECGANGCHTTGDENAACFPIPVPDGDPNFSGQECLTFVRSEGILSEDCKIGGYRNQLNQITSFVDGSNIYGSTAEEAAPLKDTNNPDRGRLIMTPHPDGYRGLLPTDSSLDCKGSEDCFVAGDSRVNENPALSSLHTIWQRYHNVIEGKLYQLHSDWDGKTLFQESRRIVSAIWQQAVFREWVPIVLGPEYTNLYDLKPSKGFYKGYNRNVNPGIINGFATAAMRFGHSLITTLFHYNSQSYDNNQNVHFSEVFDNADNLYQSNLPGGAGVDSILFGFISAQAGHADHQFTKQVTAHLFTDNPPFGVGTDLASLNIQRGRDHGIPAYNEWREWCGLPRAENFNDLSDIPEDVRNDLASLYDHVDDIDLFVGGMVEDLVPAGTVGRTFACIVGHQFYALKAGDRFFYENKENNKEKIPGFSKAQLDAIRKVTLSRVMCDTLDDVENIQKWVLLQPRDHAMKLLGMKKKRHIYDYASLYKGEKNERKPCSALPELDLSSF